MIRSLKAGETVPEGEPRRYRSGHGYMRLRWRVAPREYVEVYEHRVVDGRVVDAPLVHHRNGVKDDNDPSNLEPVTPSEHGEHHRSVDYAQVVRLYEAGHTTTWIGDRLGTSSGHVSRILQTEGVSTRRMGDYVPGVAEADLRAAVADPLVRSAADVANRFRLPVPTVYRLMREYGIPSFPPGRRKGRAA